ncbi:Dienelactone hydrolase [Nitrosomonas cryotolerans]|uniref:Dienelactone hydrolase n=1 Tax=Nitrosomonas cryotolerans ATCC 49181 TaxID=1131553 RepID=A0A1N6GMC1_9PROT|nr:dienelactone hydrolase family protein [Nitrosomonas cryotolerans]SFP97869.1 Dienelactone hydrolase [Nitrosomonas cryotolerans]SIO08666.1 Dienelactone hydrolase [Nitrosomonas cryotolerans ATCC 49181]
MITKMPLKFVFVCALLWFVSPVLQAKSNKECNDRHTPDITFVEFQSLNLEQSPPGTLTIKGKLKLPPGKSGKLNCAKLKKSEKKMPAVLILHGSSGIDARGDFYARELNAQGIATLEIDMWEARGLVGEQDRPQLPIFTYPDAFAALAFLSTQGNIDPARVGILGFSWGGVVTMASAEELYADRFGGDLRFAAHVAHYPLCYGYNNPAIPPLNPSDERGTQWLNLTGAPVLIQIGTEDDYDNGAEHCRSLIDGLIDPNDQDVVEVVAYEGAFHAWDRLQIPITVLDPFADEGSIFMTGMVPSVNIIPDVDQAYEARKKVVRFFRRNL